MTEATLAGFRAIADTMGCTGDWQWEGKWMSQRMYGITRERAEEMAKRHGGEAKQMKRS